MPASGRPCAQNRWGHARHCPTWKLVCVLVAVPQAQNVLGAYLAAYQILVTIRPNPFEDLLNSGSSRPQMSCSLCLQVQQEASGGPVYCSQTSIWVTSRGMKWQERMGCVSSSRVFQQVPLEQKVAILPLSILNFPLLSQVPAHLPKDLLPDLIQPVLLTSKVPA